MKGSLFLGSVSGIKIFVHWTFLILIGWIVFTNVRAGYGTNEIFWSITFVLTIFACVTLHELGHALAAKRFNIKTRDITLLPIGGVASLEAIPDKPKEELIVAFAGPAVNLAIAAVLYPFTQLGQVDEVENMAHVNAGNFIPLVMSVNLVLLLFNLIPAFPMDGGRVLRALLSFKMPRARATRIAASIGQVLAIGFVFIGFFYNPFLVFIGLFIFLGAQSEAVYSEAQSLLEGYTVGEVVMNQIPTIPSHASVREAARVLLETQNRNFVVADDRTPMGTLNRDEIIRSLSAQDDTLVRDVMDKDMIAVQSTIPLQKVWQQMQQQRKTLALVYRDQDLVGVVDNDNLAEFIMIRTAQEKKSVRSI